MKNKFVHNALVFFAIFTMTITGAMANTLEKAKTTGKFTLAYRESSICLLYTSPSPRDVEESRMPSSA